MLNFALGYSVGVIAPLLVQVAAEFDLSVGTAGLLSTAFAIPGVVIALVAGPLSDLYGRKRFLVVGATILSTGLLAGAFAPTFEVLLVCRVISGIGSGICGGAVHAVIPDTFAYHERGRVVAWAAAAQSIVIVLGIPLAGIVAEATSWRHALVIPGVLAGLVAVMLALRLQRSTTTNRATSFIGAYASILRHRPARSMLGVMFLAAMPSNTWFIYLVAFYQTLFTLPQGIASTLVLASGAAGVFGSQLMGRAGDRYGHRRLLGLVLLVYAMTILVVSSAPLPLVLAVALSTVLGALRFGYLVSLQTLLFEQVPQARGTMGAAHTSLNQLSTAVGAASGGYSWTGRASARWAWPASSGSCPPRASSGVREPSR